MSFWQEPNNSVPKNNLRLDWSGGKLRILDNATGDELLVIDPDTPALRSTDMRVIDATFEGLLQSTRFSILGEEVLATGPEINESGILSRYLRATQDSFDPVTAAGTVSAFWYNYLSVPVIVNRVLVDIATATSAANTMVVGTATAATTADNIFESFDLSAAATFDSLAQTANATVHKLDPGEFVTATITSGATATIEGTMTIFYTPVE